MAKLKGDLGPLERTVMDLVWDRGAPVTVRDLLDAPGTRGLAYTTIMTVLERLWRKGLLSRRRVGRAYFYQSRMTRGEYVQSLVGHVIARSNDRHSVLLGFVRSVDPNDLDELRQLIRDVERERREAKGQ